MKTNRPYLIRALNEWILDNACTPYLLVDAEFDGVIVPEAYINHGEILLNIHPEAVLSLQITNCKVSFQATFAGDEWQIVVPMQSIKAIYAKEDPQGMMFDREPDDIQWAEGGRLTSGGDSKTKPPHLTIVK